jgi:hypothetical protein
MRHPLPADVIAAMDRREKIEAIRLLRASAGLGLAQAKEAVEVGYFETPDPLPTPSAPMSLPPEAVRALLAGDKIGAIKIVRVAHGIGLKDAKDVVDAAEHALPPQSRLQGKSLAPGEVDQASGRKVGFVILVLAVAVAAWFLLRKP